MRRGQPRKISFHRRPRRGQAAAPLALSGHGSRQAPCLYSIPSAGKSRSASREAEATCLHGKVPNPAGSWHGWMCRASPEGDTVPAQSPTRNRFLERLERGPVIVGDGGMGALLSAAVPRLRSPEEANL